MALPCSQDGLWVQRSLLPHWVQWQWLSVTILTGLSTKPTSPINKHRPKIWLQGGHPAQSKPGHPSSNPEQTENPSSTSQLSHTTVQHKHKTLLVSWEATSRHLTCLPGAPGGIPQCKHQRGNFHRCNPDWFLEEIHWTLHVYHHGAEF